MMGSKTKIQINLNNFFFEFSSKKEELMVLAGQKPYSIQNKQHDVWQNFYDRLKDIRVELTLLFLAIYFFCEGIS